MSYDIYWKLSDKGLSVKSQTRAFEAPHRGVPTPEETSRIEAIAREISGLNPRISIHPNARGIEYGCHFAPEGVEPDEDPMSFVSVDIDGVSFNWSFGALRDKEFAAAVESVSSVLFDSGYVAYDPQIGELFFSVDALMFQLVHGRPKSSWRYLTKSLVALFKS
jgi:hypothetical protein